MTELIDIFREWLDVQKKKVDELPPPDHPDHPAARLKWAEEADHALTELRDRLGVPG